MNFYDKYILPHFLTCACSMGPIREQREHIVPQARGRVLELGMGPGHNLAYYDPARVEEVIGVDPSAELRPKARRAAAKVPFAVDYQETTAEDMQVDDASIDTLVVMFTMCTIPDAVSALSACRRVLKPEAEVLFCEHGAAPDPGVAKWQTRLNPVWKKIAGGCNLNRPIPSLLEQAGYRITQMDQSYLQSALKVAAYVYRGRARAA